MKNTKHTQGPWKVLKKLNCTGYDQIVSEKNPNVVVANDLYAKDAALIAAAPDMIEALETALPHIKGSFAGMKAMELVVAAIQKAKGE